MERTKRGRILWVPPVVIDEINDIIREDDLVSRAEAFRKLVKYTRVGREAKRLTRFDFSKAMPRIPVEEYPMRKKKYKRNPNAKNFYAGVI